MRIPLVVITLFLAQLGSSANGGRMEKLLEKGIKAYNHGNYKKALRKYKKARALDTNDWRPSYHLSICLFVMEKYEDALVESKRLYVQPGPYQLHGFITAGSALDNLKRRKEAIESMDSNFYMISVPDSV